MELPLKKYQIIYADPPWQYDDPKGNDPSMGGITYQTMTDDELCRLPVSHLADSDCSLFLWATMPKLKEAFQIIDAWGFKYITCAFVWVKQNRNGDGIYSGLGHWVNGNAELCLFAKKGTPSRINKDVKQIILAPVARHSKKPAEARMRIVDLMGELPRIELFCRKEDTLFDSDGFDGWDVWGNEVDSDIKLEINK